MLERDQKKLWSARAENYSRLCWVSDNNLEAKILEVGDFKSDHCVLDAGTGTGAVARSIAPYVKVVHGIDQSPEMLALAKNNGENNINYQLGDIRNMPFSSSYFDRVTSRNVFHNILDSGDRQNAVAECFRVLKPKGKFVFSEGVPPHESLKADFEKIFSLKEIRITFSIQDIVDLLSIVGFSDIKSYSAVAKDFELNNWLDNDGTLNSSVKKAIIDLHIHSSEKFKELYNLRVQGSSVLIDTVSAFVVGTKAL